MMEIMIKIIRVLIFSFICIFTLIFFSISYKDMLIISFLLNMIFLAISLTYYSISGNNKYRKSLLDIWKIYAPSILVLFTILFSTYNYILNQEIDYEKTKLNYNLQIKNENKYENIKAAYNSYEEKIKNELKMYDKRYILEIKNFKEYFSEMNNLNDIKPNSDEDNYIFWWAHPILYLINLLTLFMLLRFFTELNIINIRKNIL